MKVLLISASNEGWDTGLFGLASLATYAARKRPDVSLRLVDSTLEVPLVTLKDFKPDLVGISSMTVSHQRAKHIADSIRQEAPGLPILIGGNHVSALPSLLEDCFDIGVIGEGEETFIELLDACASGLPGPGALARVPSIAYHTGEGVVVTDRRPLIPKLDSIPPVDRELLKRYYLLKTVHGKPVIEAGLMTSRGCPFKCRFCASAVFWDKTRFNSAERIVDEIETLVKSHHVDLISCWDDTFAIKKNRLEEIRAGMEAKGLLGKVRFGGHARATHFDDETAGLLKAIGFEALGFGFESGSERMLPWMKRNVSVENNYRAVDIAKRHGFFVNGYLIIANPTETMDDMRDSMRFLDYMHEKGVNLVMVFAATPFPGTEYWDIALERGIVSEEMDWDILDQNDLFKPLMLDAEVDRGEYLRLAEEFTVKMRTFDPFSNRSFRQILMAPIKKPGLALKVGRELLRQRLGR